MAEAIPPGLRASLPLALAALRREVATDGRPIVLHVCCLLGALGGRVNAVQHELAPRSVADLFTLAASRAVSDLTLTSGRNVREEVATLRAEIHNVEGLLASEDAAVLQELEQDVTAGMTPSCARVWAVLTASGALPWRESILFKDIVAEQRSCVIATPHAQVARIESALDGVWDPVAAARAFFKVLPVCRGRGLDPALAAVCSASPRPVSIVGLEVGPSTARFLWSKQSSSSSSSLFNYRRALLATTFAGRVHASLPRIEPAVDVGALSQEWSLEERLAETWDSQHGQWSATLRVQT